MTNGVIQLINHLSRDNAKLKEQLDSEKAKRVYVSTTLSDARYVIREQKRAIAKLERKMDRIRARRLSKLKRLFFQ